MVWRPRSWQARKIRMAISPRLATRTFLNAWLIYRSSFSPPAGGNLWFSLVYTNPAAGCNGFQPGFVNFIPPSYFEPG